MPARVDEDQRRAVLARSARRAGRRPAPRPRPTSPLRAATAAARARGRARGDGRCRRSCSRRAVAVAPAPTRKRATSSIGFCVAERPMRSRRSPHSASQPLEREREMAAALVRRERVDLVDDHRARRRQHRAAGLGAEQDVERFRRRDDDVRRPPAHALRARPAACRRCAPACGSRRPAGPARASSSRMPASGASRLLLDVVRQRLQRRDVDDLRLVRQPAARRPARTRSSIAARKAASVLPEPVGAAISVCRPAWIAGQASACAARRRGEACARTRRRRPGERGRSRFMDRNRPECGARGPKSTNAASKGGVASCTSLRG